MNQQEVIEKIQKLLKLSESPFEEEGKVAMEKARKLMVQYHIEEQDLQGEQKEEVITEDYVFKEEIMSDIWFFITENNRVKMFKRKSFRYGEKPTYHAIMVGYKVDIQYCIAMMEYITECFTNGLREIRRKIRMGETVKINGELRTFDATESTAGLKNEYYWGFSEGLKDIIKEQNEKSEYHLMVIIPPEVNEEYDEVTSDIKFSKHTVSRKYYRNNNNDLIRSLSMQDGRDAGKRNQLADAN